MKKDQVQIIHGDMFDVLPTMEAQFDLIIFDPPYGIGSNVLTHDSKKWKKSAESWDDFESLDSQYQFYLRALSLLVSKLKDTGNIFVFGSRHCIYMLGDIIQRILKLKIVNSIIWNKKNAMFSITRRSLIEGTEQIIWAAASQQYFFDYDRSKIENYDRQMRNVWESSITANHENISHPHQKPRWLVSRIIKIACPEGGLILDPCSGSGAVGIMAPEINRRAICIEKNADYFREAEKKIKSKEELNISFN